MVYFMQPTDGGPVNIGFTDNVDARHRQLETHYGRPLALLATTDGGREEEASIHGRFAHLRLGRTEQFRPAPDLMAFIGRPLLVDPNPDAVEVVEPTRRDVRIVATGEWADWIDRAARHCRTDIAKLIDAAVVEYVKARGFRRAPAGAHPMIYFMQPTDGGQPNHDRN